jgi:hypothetical protein
MRMAWCVKCRCLQLGRQDLRNCLEICTSRQMRDTYNEEARNKLYILTTTNVWASFLSISELRIVSSKSVIEGLYQMWVADILMERQYSVQRYCFSLKTRSIHYEPKRIGLSFAHLTPLEPSPTRDICRMPHGFCSTAIIDGSKTNSKYPTRNPTESFARNE